MKRINMKLTEDYNQEYRRRLSGNIEAIIKYLQIAKKYLDTYNESNEKEFLQWLVDDLHMTSGDLNDIVKDLQKQAGISKYYD